ncbi:MAG: serine/threonine protein kinase, partial [Planctomycetes bacterium]|nr:serine/threonine protein kinase [Planctomycetota bacterium]
MLFGEYEILGRIGNGGMSQVYKARHRTMNRIVALKVLPPKATISQEAVQRFHREARAAAKLDHPNIVTAYDAGGRDGIHYLVMEYIEGQDLGSFVKEHGPLPVDLAVSCIVQAAIGLEYTHRRGFVHRDVKPANILLAGSVKDSKRNVEAEQGQASYDPCTDSTHTSTATI